MGTSERNFANFQLGDNPLELAGGLLPEVAERYEFTLGSEPNADALGQLVGYLGKSAVLRENPSPKSVGIKQVADWVERSGIMQPLDRLLLNPDMPAQRGSLLVMTGGVANWMDRSEELLKPSNRLLKDGNYTGVIIAAGTRIMNSVTEVNNPRVKAFAEETGHLPDEAEYAKRFILPSLRQLYTLNSLQSCDTKNGDELANLFVANNQDLLEQGRPLTFVRVASAGVQLALQMRRAIQKVSPGYDSPDAPKIGILTDTISIAQTRVSIAKPTRFQSPFTALRQVALTAKLLHEATQ